MFEPATRRSITDFLRPPTGYRLDAGAFTTFSLDFTALTAIFLALIDGELEGATTSGSDPEILRAIVGLSQKVRIFVERGGIAPGTMGRGNPTVSLYDIPVRELSIPGGRFHPKVWAVKFIPRRSPGMERALPVVRLACSSRNLTLSSTWEIIAGFEGKLRFNSPRSSLGREAAEFLGTLSREGADRKILDPLIDALPYTEFQFPSEVGTHPRFLWQGFGGHKLWDEFPAGGQQALIVSPFCRAGFLEKVLARFKKIVLVSTQRELDAIDDPALQKRLSSQDVYVIRTGLTEEENTSELDLHAKIFICESGNSSITMLGSANATSNAWNGRNCEAEIVFSPGVTVKYFMKKFLFDEKGELNGWVQKYSRQAPDSSEELEADTLIEKAKQYVSELKLNGKYDSKIRTLCLSIDGQPGNKLRETLQQLTMRICPLALSGNPRYLADGKRLLTEGSITWEAISPINISEFILITIASPRAEEKSFVLKAKIPFKREDRATAVLQDALSSDKFRQFLRCIIFDSFRQHVPSTVPSEPSEGGHSHGGRSILDDIALEDILRACTEDPDRISEIDRSLEMFKDTGYIDESFRSFWAEFKAAAGMTNLGDGNA